MNISISYKNFIAEAKRIEPEILPKFKFSINDEKLYFVMESLNEINKLKEKFKNFFKNHHRIPNLEDVINNFIAQKNQFINDMNTFLKISKDINKSTREILFQTNNILKFRLDEFITQYKVLKQKIYSKSKVKDNYYELKEKFFNDTIKSQNFGKKKIENLNLKEGINKKNSINKDDRNENGEFDSKDSKINKISNKEKNKGLKNEENYYINNIGNNQDNDYEIVEPPKAQWVQKYLPKENKSINETLNILNDLSNLMKSFSQKVYFHSEMANQSKKIKY